MAAGALETSAFWILAALSKAPAAGAGDLPRRRRTDGRRPGEPLREQLVEEVRKLRRGIREHRDSTGQSSAGIIPASGASSRAAGPAAHGPDWPEFLRGCIRYRQSLDEKFPRLHVRRRSTTDSPHLYALRLESPVPLR